MRLYWPWQPSVAIGISWLLFTLLTLRDRIQYVDSLCFPICFLAQQSLSEKELTLMGVNSFLLEGDKINLDSVTCLEMVSIFDTSPGSHMDVKHFRVGM